MEKRFVKVRGVNRNIRQQKKLNKKAYVFLDITQQFIGFAWRDLCSQYQNHYIKRNGMLHPKQNETPRLVLRWARENLSD